MKKSCLIVGVIGAAVILVCSGVGFLIFGTVFMATSGLVSSADTFLTAAADESYQVAYSELSQDLKKTVSPQQLESFISENGLNEYQTVFWNNRSIDNSTGLLEGNVTTKSGGTIPVKLTFVKEQSGWKIQSIDKTAVAGLGLDSPNIGIPTDAEAKRLVQLWTQNFGAGVVKKDFSDFHAKTAAEFQRKIPLTDFTDRFKSFIEQELDLSWVDGTEPVFDEPPSMTNQGVLKLTGHFPADPLVTFDYKLVKRDSQWQALGLHLTVGDAKAESTESIEELDDTPDEPSGETSDDKSDESSD